VTVPEYAAEAAGRPLVACVGESMAVLTSERFGPLDGGAALRLGFGGAESNTALALAALGQPTAWISRVGMDDLGDSLVSVIKSGGVDTAAVARDALRPTGLYIKQPGSTARPRYYRRGSAASALGPELLADPAASHILDQADLVHLSGITAALSDSALALVNALLARPRRYRVSFDLNWRPALWHGRDHSVLRDLLDGADLAFLGADEAAAVLGTGAPTALRALLPTPMALVVKDAEHLATAVDNAGTAVCEPALKVEVVEPTGAGDAFAAGYLAGFLRQLTTRHSLRLGHLTAASVLVSQGDHRPPPPPEVITALLEASAADWAATIVTRDGIDSPALRADGANPAPPPDLGPRSLDVDTAIADLSHARFTEGRLRLS